MNAQKHTVIINGRLYDAVSGMPVPHSDSQAIASAPANKPQPSAPAKKPTAHRPHQQQPNAHQVHQHVQKSQTLNRAPLKRPETTTVRQDVVVPAHRSPVITKFATNKITAHAAIPHLATHQHHPVSQQAESAIEQPARLHPVVQRAMARQQQLKQAAAKPVAVPLSQLKEELIKQQLAAAKPDHTQHHPATKNPLAKRPRLASVLAASLAMLVLGGYLTYFNLPNISMRVAATRANIAATLPEYKPEGYRFSGPITYAPGEVSATYKSPAGDAAYTITQKSSNWDSQAVLQNYVVEQSRVYLTYQEHGLTIYSFGNSAAWVNGGILYTVDGNAPLSSEQLLNIATSL